MVAQPLQHFEAVDTGHLDVGKHDAGKRKLPAVLVFSSAAQIIKSILAVREDLHGVLHANFSERPLQKDAVVLAVFSDENGQIAIHMDSPSQVPWSPPAQARWLP